MIAAVLVGGMAGVAAAGPGNTAAGATAGGMPLLVAPVVISDPVNLIASDVTTGPSAVTWTSPPGDIKTLATKLPVFLGMPTERSVSSLGGQSDGAVGRTTCDYYGNAAIIDVSPPPIL